MTSRPTRHRGSIAAALLFMVAVVTLGDACDDDPTTAPFSSPDGSVPVLDAARPAPSGPSTPTDAAPSDSSTSDGDDAGDGLDATVDGESDASTDAGATDADALEGGTDASDDDGGSTEDGGVADASDGGGQEDAAGACNTLTLTATDKPLRAAAPPAPAPAGGAIAPGTYDLDDSFEYTNSDPPGTVRDTLDAVTLRFDADGTYYTAHADGSKSKGTWSVTGTDLTLNIDCPAVVGPIVRPYTATTTTLRVYYMAGNGDVLEHVYQKTN